MENRLTMIEFSLKVEHDQPFYRPNHMVRTTGEKARCISLADRTLQEDFDISFL